jgi:hypothetical protein
MRFAGSAGQFLLLGDCTGQAGNLQKTMRSAFFVASQVRCFLITICRKILDKTTIF